MIIDKVRIGAIDYQVIQSPKLGERHDLDGQIVYNSSEIMLDSTAGDQAKFAVLMHEIIHGIVYAAKTEDCFKDEQSQEKVIDVIAIGLLGVIRDNNDLIYEIMELWEE